MKNANTIVFMSKTRYFSLREFDETLCYGYARLINSKEGLKIEVMDSGNLCAEKEANLFEKGYVKKN